MATPLKADNSAAAPPVVIIQAGAFDTGAVIREVCAHNPKIGAVASFTGIMRDLNEGEAVEHMTLEHYPGMTERAIEEIVEQARERWQLIDVRVVHRVGELAPTDPIVLVVTASSHRGDAFAACEFIMDYLKTRAPFWKKEATGAGERWVESRESDHQSADRWKR